MKHKLSKVEQLKVAILDDIRTGIYRAGDELPSIRQLCIRYHMSKQTISQALSELNQRGILNVSHGRATRITGHPEARRIALVYGSKTSIEKQEFWREFYRGIMDEMPEAYELDIFQIGTEGERGLRERLTSQQTSGVIILGSMYYENIWQQIKERNLPTVRVYDTAVGKNAAVSLVSADFRQGMSDAVKLLRSRGCRNIAYFGVCIDPQIRTIDNDKLEYFQKALEEHGLPFVPRLMLNSLDMEPESSYRQMLPLLRSASRPDAILLASDIMAPGTCRAAYECGLQIPHDLNMISCDNLAIGRLLVPSLTSIDQQRHEQGRFALRHLLALISGDAGHIQKFMPVRMIIRESCPDIVRPLRKNEKTLVYNQP